MVKINKDYTVKNAGERVEADTSKGPITVTLGVQRATIINAGPHPVTIVVGGNQEGLQHSDGTYGETPNRPVNNQFGPEEGNKDD